VPRAYDIFRVYEGLEGENKNKEMKNRKCNIKNKIQDFKNTIFQKNKFHYKPTCVVGSV
jgi:hypothetical protein